MVKKVTVTMVPANNVELSGAAVAISQKYLEQDVKVYDDDLLIQLLTFGHYSSLCSLLINKVSETGLLCAGMISVLSILM
jgi:hypothetical protein